jgi:hypothetical protein
MQYSFDFTLTCGCSAVVFSFNDRQAVRTPLRRTLLRTAAALDAREHRLGP